MLSSAIEPVTCCGTRLLYEFISRYSASWSSTPSRIERHVVLGTDGAGHRRLDAVQVLAHLSCLDVLLAAMPVEHRGRSSGPGDRLGVGERRPLQVFLGDVVLGRVGE